MFDGRYLDWNQKRIKGIVDYYGHQFMFYKKVLDLGCGHADISGVLHRLGADITAVDARQSHLQMASKKFPGIKVIKSDLDGNWPFYGKKFDLTLDLDLICHLQNYEQHLRAVCASTSHLVLETTVIDSEDPYCSLMIPENKNVYDLSANGSGNVPSAAAIERILEECNMDFKRIDSSKFNSGSYVYDWKSENNNNYDANKRRIWFASKKEIAFQPLNSEPNKLVHSPTSNMGYVQSLKDTNIPVSDAHFLSKSMTKTQLETKKLRAALCISGHLRTFEDNFKSVHDHILNRMDCDVFIHTWDSLGLPYRPCDGNIHKIPSQIILDKIKLLYQPKKLIMEPNREFDITPLMRQRQLDHRDVSGILSMYYKIEACNKLKKDYEIENGFKYDCVIRFRGDLFMETPLPIDKNSNFGNLYLPMYGNFGGANDQLAFGSSHIMDVYSSLYSNIEHYLRKGAPMHPEKILQYHIDINKLPVAKVNIRYLIKRANGLVQDNFLLERAWGFIR